MGANKNYHNEIAFCCFTEKLLESQEKSRSVLTAPHSCCWVNVSFSGSENPVTNRRIDGQTDEQLEKVTLI